MESDGSHEDDSAPVQPRRVRWLLILIALLIIASSAIALQTVDQAAPTTSTVTTDPNLVPNARVPVYGQYAARNGTPDPVEVRALTLT